MCTADPLPGTHATDSHRGSPWRLLPLGLLLAVSIYLRLTDVIPVTFEPNWFIVLLAGWMGDRYGPRAAGALAALGVPAIVFVSWQVGALNMHWGFGIDAFLLAVFAALAFGRPPAQSAVVLAPLLRSRWRLGLWLALLVLSLAAFASLDYDLKVTQALSVKWSVSALVVLAALGATVKWNAVLERWVGRKALFFLLALPVTAALLASFTFDIDTAAIGLGFSDTDGWLLVACFALCAFRIVDWRPVLGVLALAFLADLTAWRIEPDLTPTLAAAGGIDASDHLALLRFGFDNAVAWTLVLNCASAALLGVVLSAFWCDREIAPLRTTRSIALLGVVLALQFIAVPASQEDYQDWNFLVLGGLGYTLGLIGRAKAVFAGPLLILTCAFLSVASFGEPTAWFSSYASNLPRIGPTVFVFCFFGVLSNRYAGGRAGEHAATTSGSRAEQRGGGAMIVDVTALATIVRRLDVSATLRAFVAVLAPLVVLWQLGVIVNALASLSELDGFAEILDNEDALFAAAIVALAIAGAFAPLGFIVADWAARHASWRHLTAVSGAALGGVLFTLIGAAPGAVAYLLSEAELVESAAWARGIVVAIGLAVLAWLVSRLTARSRRSRALLSGVAIVALVVVIGLAAPLLLAENPDDPSFAALVSVVAALLLVVGVAAWLVRAVWLRILLSGDRPRALLLGAFQRPRFLVRFAYLIGLPSSLWSLRAMRTAAFWAFIASRPLVYVGFALAFRGNDVDALGGSSGSSARLVLAALLVLGGHLAFYLGKRLAARRIWNPHDSSDPRSPILFLRSFADDQLGFKRRPWDLVGRWFDLWSFRRNADEMLIDEIAQFGPVVALGQPGEKLVPFGAARYYSAHGAWQAIITETARRAQAIIIVAGDSPGVLWEFELLAKESLVARTVLLFRPGADARNSNRRALQVFPRSDHSADLPGTIAADAHWVALLPTSTGPRLLTAAQATAAAYVLALRAYFQKCDARVLESAELSPLEAREATASTSLVRAPSI
jgi:hypothetical protein